jgi:hypothetical protein
MAKANGSSNHERCRSYAHKWDSDVCTVCFADSQAGARSRAWNAMMTRIVAAGADSYGTVPPPPDYSTPEAVQARALEMASPWYRSFMAITRTDGRTYRAFRRAVERTGATMALPFETTGAIATTAAPAASRDESRAPRCPRSAPRVRRHEVAA